MNRGNKEILCANLNKYYTPSKFFLMFFERGYEWIRENCNDKIIKTYYLVDNEKENEIFFYVIIEMKIKNNVKHDLT